MQRRFVVYTDLDGTLLDHHTYSFDKAVPALRLLESEGVPLIINSSKTRPEIERYRSLLGNTHPFVTENGGGIFIPENYFSRSPVCDKRSDGYCIVELGAPREELKAVLTSV
ncbi:MAG TPA: HAD hydrolase family protein, partial [Thermodesulfobacteriota bacterium]|nr:HAD hydrolase family protein [Thermodesulfobacteriota bacterium]